MRLLLLKNGCITLRTDKLATKRITSYLLNHAMHNCK
ncbi:hypothetical protein D918_00126 [Trichuris suis]|nr:hypothetical protein D918_00126 [Trichuris suis]